MPNKLFFIDGTAQNMPLQKYSITFADHNSLISPEILHPSTKPTDGANGAPQPAEHIVLRERCQLWPRESLRVNGENLPNKNASGPIASRISFNDIRYTSKRVILLL